MPPPRLGSVLDELLRSLLGCLGFGFGFRDLVVKLLLDLLSLVFGIRLGFLALPLDELGGGLLRLGDTLFDLPARFALHVPDASLTALAHLACAFGERLGLPRGLDGSLLGLPGTLRGITCAPRADLDGVADRRGVDDGGRHLPPLVAHAGGSVLSGCSARERSQAAFDGISRKPVRVRSSIDITPSGRKHANC